MSSFLPSTLTDPTISGPGSSLKTTPPPPGYPWVSEGRYVTQEARFRGFLLDHQGLEELELKNHPGVDFTKDLGQLESRSVSVQ